MIKSKILKKKAFLNAAPREKLPDFYHKLIIESENKYYENPCKNNIEYLLYLYKTGIEFYSVEEPQKVFPLMKRMEIIIKQHEPFQEKFQAFLIKIRINNQFFILQTKKDILNEKAKLVADDLYKKYEQAQRQYNDALEEALNEQSSSFKTKFEKKKEKKDQITQTPVKRSSKRKVSAPYSSALLLNKKSFTSSKRGSVISTPKLFNSLLKQIVFDSLPFSENKKLKRNTFGMEKIENFLNKFYFEYSKIIKENSGKILHEFDQEYRTKISKEQEYFDAVSEFSQIINEEDSKFSDSMKELVANLTNEHQKELEKIEVETKEKIRSIISSENSLYLEKEHMEIFGPMINSVINDVIELL